MKLTPINFFYLVEIFNIYQKDKLYKKGFSSGFDLAKSLSKKLYDSDNPSSQMRNFVKQLQEENIVILSEKKTIVLNEDLCLKIIESSNWGKIVDTYNENTKVLNF